MLSFRAAICTLLGRTKSESVPIFSSHVPPMVSPLFFHTRLYRATAPKALQFPAPTMRSCRIDHDAASFYLPWPRRGMEEMIPPSEWRSHIIYLLHVSSGDHLSPQSPTSPHHHQHLSKPSPSDNASRSRAGESNKFR